MRDFIERESKGNWTNRKDDKTSKGRLQQNNSIASLANEPQNASEIKTRQCKMCMKRVGNIIHGVNVQWWVPRPSAEHRHAISQEGVATK